MINVVIPMAGMGSRFLAAGYKNPKPFIDVLGKTMIERVMDNLKLKDARYILLVRREHVDSHQEIVTRLKKQYNAEFVLIDKLTEGAACTVLYARDWINNDTPLLIANSDQIVDVDMDGYIKDCDARQLDGSILTFRDNDPKWSYARIDSNGYVTMVREKECISEYATVGIYFFTKGRYFLDAAIDMIARNNRVKNEFYVCPAYNYMIADGRKIGIYNIDLHLMHGTGTPADLEQYMELLK